MEQNHLTEIYMETFISQTREFSLMGLLCQAMGTQQWTLHSPCLEWSCCLELKYRQETTAVRKNARSLSVSKDRLSCPAWGSWQAEGIQGEWEARKKTESEQVCKASVGTSGDVPCEDICLTKNKEF